MATSSNIEKNIASVGIGNKRFDRMIDWERAALEEFKQEYLLKYFQLPEFLYIQRMRSQVFGIHLRLGFSEADLKQEEIANVQKLADKIAKNKEGRNNFLAIEVGPIPQDGEFLIFDADQGYAIARAMPRMSYEKFDRVEVVYLAVLELMAEDENSQPEKLIEILISLASRCIDCGHRRKALACLESCENALSELAYDQTWKESHPETFIRQFADYLRDINHLFVRLEAPEKALTLTSLYLSLIKAWERNTEEKPSLMLELEIKELFNHANDIRREIQDFRTLAQAAFGTG